jgi:plasmid stability protein
MGQVLVRNLDDSVIESLKTKAELKVGPSSKSCATFSRTPHR